MNDSENNKKRHQIKFEHISVSAEQLSIPPENDALPLITTRNLVLFPGVVVNFELGRETARSLAKEAEGAAFPIGIVCQKNPEQDDPSVTSGLYRYGVYAQVLKVIEFENQTPVAIVRGLGRFRITGTGRCAQTGSRIPRTAKVKPLEDAESENGNNLQQLGEIIKTQVLEALSVGGDPQNIAEMTRSFEKATDLINYLATNLPLDIQDKVVMLGTADLYDRGQMLLQQINLFRERLAITEEIVGKARRSMDENQRNAFLQSQMEAIRQTLYGEEDDEVDTLIARAESSGMPEVVMDTFRREAEKMRRFNPSSPDYSVQYTYLDTLCRLPWNKYSTDNCDIARARAILDEDHFGLQRVKDRVLEQLAMLFHNPDGRAAIVCLVGPPGVGKTSVGKSVAKALGRKYERVSFGGLHDESEIRGHRRTYIGAMPGRIIDAMKRAQSANPVIVLDEIDKIGKDYKGDPSAALLEVLDPEQNCHFHDNYIDVDFDLSKVLFIATANGLSNIPKPLLDRMEIINLSGYLAEEKMEIARRHLVPRALANHRIGNDSFAISDAAMAAIIADYTSESGVRELEKKINSLMRKSVLAGLENNTFPNPVEPQHLYSLLGLAPHIADRYEGNDIAGVVTGLAWTETGGEILLAEAILTPAKEGTVSATGNLGKVMQESAEIAYRWIRSNAEKIGVDRKILDTHAVHVHFPEGAIPKDGPSAGITIATAIVSALKGKKVAPRISMTGEISLRGKVLPVGGIREKVLAAKRAGIKTVIMCEKNRRDIDDMPENYRKDMEFVFVDTVYDVFRYSITDEDASDITGLAK